VLGSVPQRSTPRVLLALLVSAGIALIALAPAAQASGPRANAADLDCADFPTQADAQRYFLGLGGPSSDPDQLDGDGDGIACELNPCPCSHSTTPETPTPPAPPAPPPAPTTPHADSGRLSFQAVVTGVTDGDTIKVRRGSSKRYTVRLIGIDTPETKKPGTPVECGGPAATSNMLRLAFTRARDTDGDGLRDRAGGKGLRVRVTTDPSQDRRDRYGRLLAYVKGARGSLAGAQLRAGWAAVYVFADPFAQLGAFQAAESSARAHVRGAWRQCGGNFHQPV
jgi:endonuclease YncB( thermonuclease family)